MTPTLILVVAAADNGVIGRDNHLLWRLKTDLKRFRALTWGKPMIMGRKTFQSIGKPLPGRETVVLTRDPAFEAAGTHAARTWDDAVAQTNALAQSMGANEVAIVGGAEIYALALPHVQKIFLTKVHAAPEGDAVFPALDPSVFREFGRQDHPKGPDDEHPFTFIDLERRR
ncbi:dihydrofolate reductase [Microvirga brassicacearum]|uniref:Dihydrofolate reductase n=1 Tax=Microvirga brassicacearum TaxID=2580413 RepID=A0A5N3PBI7_9HYPH|nr:dihydrofolate reductase [Microvirga brassicacearum]KAB0266995.1 dihydrofolate reductase [Microvirga brassicacearum]